MTRCFLGAALLAGTLAMHELGAQVPVAGASPAAGTVSHGSFTLGELTRAYRLFVPASRPPAGARTLLVMLHGCTQDAADFALGTQLEVQGAARGLTVLWPEQEATAHPQRCWQWYDPAHNAQDTGESALIAALVAQVVRQEGVAPERVVIGGVSAGGAMAANIAAMHPTQFAGLVVHSGVPALAAGNVMEGLAAMRSGPALAAGALADRVVEAMGTRARTLPVLVMHGQADAVVSVANARLLAEQWRLVNARHGAQWDMVEVHIIAGLGHAWSGGDSRGTYTDPRTESATMRVLDFVARVTKP